MIMYKENSLLYDDYFELRASAGWSNYSEEQTVKALLGSLYDVTAVDGDETVGMARIIGDGLYYLIVDVVVKPAYQGQGIGRRLVGMLLDYVECSVPEGSRASVQLIAAQGKEGFYDGMGFKVIPNDSCGPGMRIIVHKGA